MKQFLFSIAPLALGLALAGMTARAAESEQATEAGNANILGCSECVKNIMQGQFTSRSNKGAADVVNDLTNGAGKAPDLGDSTTGK